MPPLGCMRVAANGDPPMYDHSADPPFANWFHFAILGHRHLHMPTLRMGAVPDTHTSASHVLAFLRRAPPHCDVAAVAPQQCLMRSRPASQCAAVGAAAGTLVAVVAVLADGAGTDVRLAPADVPCSGERVGMAGAVAVPVAVCVLARS